MTTGYALLNGFTVSVGFILAIIGLMLLIISGTGETVLVIALLIILLGLQGWQYIQTLVRLDEMSEKLDELHRKLKSQ